MPNKYWQDRFIQLNEARFNRGEEYLKTIEKEYKKTIHSLQKDIYQWLKRIGANNKMNLVEAKKLLNAEELREFKWSVEEYIAYGQANSLDSRWIKELENASARVHISKANAIILQLRQHIEALYHTQDEGLKALTKEIFEDGYYRTIYEVQRFNQIGTPFSKINQRKLDSILSKPWSTDGKNFSTRIWDNKQKLIGELQSQLTQMYIRGDAPEKAINSIAKTMDVSRKQAGRLVMTESAYFSSEGQKKAFEELDVEQYEIVATLDTHTSEICQELDGKVLDMKDYEAGVTAPPFHPWCRTVTVPYFEDNYGERAARNAEGKTYHVKSDMTYKEWYNNYVEQNTIPKKRKLEDATLDLPLRFRGEDGRFKHIPSGAEMKNGTVLFGAGVKNPIRDISRLTASYGGSKESWMKCSGIVESKLYTFDIHWYQKEDGKHFEEKIAKKVRRNEG